MGGHERVTEGTRAPQTMRVERRDMTRVWTRVDRLMFARGSHADHGRCSLAHREQASTSGSKGGRYLCAQKAPVTDADLRDRSSCYSE